MLSDVWQVIRFEYTRIVFRKQFLLVLFSPVLIALLFVVVVAFMLLAFSSDRPVGYVDMTGKLQPPESFMDNGRYTVDEDITAFSDEASGREALAEKDISALYVVEEDYFSSGHVRLVANEYPEEEAEQDMVDFLRDNVAAAYSPEVAHRLLMGSFVKIDFTGSEESDTSPVLAAVEGTFFWKMTIPMIFSVLFSVIIALINGYMLTSVLEEKANRTAEILLTSIASLRLMIGKIAANLAVGLTQMLLWGGLPLLAVGIGTAFLPNFAEMGFDAKLIGISAALLVLGVLQVSAILTICGAVVVEDREAQQISSLVMLVFMVPYFFFSKLMFEPDGTIATVLSLIPFSSPLSMPFRIALSDVPTGQIVLCFIFALLATVGLLWLAGVAFHRGIMRYEKRLKLKELFSVKGGSNA